MFWGFFLWGKKEQKCKKEDGNQLWNTATAAPVLALLPSLNHFTREGSVLQIISCLQHPDKGRLPAACPESWHSVLCLFPLTCPKAFNQPALQTLQLAVIRDVIRCYQGQEVALLVPTTASKAATPLSRTSESLPVLLPCPLFQAGPACLPGWSCLQQEFALPG